MFRSLLLLAAVAALVWFFLLRQRGGRQAQDRERQPPPRIRDTVRCTECGVHLPEDEAIRSAGKTFCSLEHRDAWQRREQQ